MKKYIIKRVLFLIIISVSFLSCTDFLKEEPTSFVDPNALLVNKSGAEKYLIGAYSATKVIATGYTGWASAWGTFAADEIVIPNWGADPKEIYLHTLTPSNTTVRTMWENFYVSVNVVNSVIDRIGTMNNEQIDSVSKNQFIAEARYLRAMLYFSLVTTWENIPLVKNETTSLNDLEVKQAPTQEVYESIIGDLQFAKLTLKELQGGGRATRGAAQALLGKVYLQMTGFPLNDQTKFALAELELDSVIKSNVYDLLPYYNDVFSLTNEQSKEIIFAIGANGPGVNAGGKLGTFYGPLGQVENGGAAGNMWFVNWELAGTKADPAPIAPQPIGTIPTSEGGGSGTWDTRNNHKFAQGYEENDIRCRINIAKHDVNKKSEIISGVTVPVTWYAEDGMYNFSARQNVAWRAANWKPWKWHNIRPSNWGSDTPFDDPYIRYADVLLMYAEALNGQNKLTQTEIDQTINRLRLRARKFPKSTYFPNGATMPNTVAVDMIAGSQLDNADEILSERRKELCFEGWRRNDLIRFGKYKDAINSTQPAWSNCGNPKNSFSDFEIRWPIPDSEIKVNPNLKQNEGYVTEATNGN